MRKATVTMRYVSMLRLKKFLASIMSLFFLVSANQAIAHGAASPVAAKPALNNFQGHLPHSSAVNHVAFPIQGTRALVSGTPAQSMQTYQLDLSSTSASVILGANLFHHAASVSINVGGVSETFYPGEQVTAAEYVAIKQTVSGGSQGLTLSGAGAATGGTFTLNSVLSSKVSELVVPADVSALDYLSASHGLTLGGDLINYGSIYGVSLNSKVTAGSLFANDINNETGGLITTDLPASVLSSLSGNAAPSVSLSLSAMNNIVNSGTISSSATLSLASTSGAITNNTGANVHALNNVSLFAGNGNLTNAGLVASTAGDINLSANPLADVNLVSTGGTYQALSGNINVRDASYSGTNNINMVGGNYLSNNLNLYAGQGNITGVVGQVSGNLNTLGNAAHFFAATPNLTIGNNYETGDPTFANIAGNVVISGTVSNSQSTVILASGNITVSGTAEVDTNNTGGSITMIAGAPITSNAGTFAAGTGISTPASSLLTAGTLTVNFSGATTGSITLTGSSVSPIINTSTNLASTQAGNVLLAAYGGSVTLPANAINASASGTGPTSGGGTVTIIAGTGTGTGVTTGAITTASTNGTAGNVSIVTAQPTGNTSTSITYNTSGIVDGTSTSTSVVAGTATASIVAIGGNITAGNVSINTTTGATTQTAGSTISASNLTLTGTTGAFGTAGANIVTTATTLAANTTGNVFINTNPNVAAQNITLNASSGATFQITDSNAAGGGNIVVSQTLAATNITLQGAAATNAGVNFASSGAITGLAGGNATTATLTANGTGQITDSVQGAPTIAATTLTMSSGTGTVGTLGSPIQTNATTLSASTGDTTAAEGVFVNDINVGTTTIAAATVGSNFNVTSLGNLTVSGSITSGNTANVGMSLTSTGGTFVLPLGDKLNAGTATLNLSSNGNLTTNANATLTANDVSVTSTGGNIAIGASITANDSTAADNAISLSTPGGGTITQANSTILLNIPNGAALSLSSTNGAMGSAGTNLSTNAATITANSLGNIFITDSKGNIIIGNSSGATFQIMDTASGTISIGSSDTLQGTTITLEGTGTNNTSVSFSSGSAITGLGVTDATTTNLKATGTGTITDGAQGFPTIGSATLNLTASSGTIGTSSAFIQTDATTLAANTNDSTAAQGVFVNSISGAAVGINASSSQSNFSVTAPNTTTLTLAGALSSGTGAINNVTLNSGGALTITGLLTGGGSGTGISTVSLTSVGTLTVSNTVKATTVGLTSTAGAISIGAAGSILAGTGNATLLSFGATTVAGPITVTSGSASLTAGNTLTINNAVKASTISLTTSTGSGANIALAAPITATAGSGTSVTISADGVGTITETAASISATGLSLSSGTGAIGTAANNITTNAPLITASSIGNVIVTDTAGNVTINSSKGATFTFTDTGSGNIDVNGTLSGTTITLAGASGSGAGVIIGANITGLAGGASRATTVTLTADGAGTITDPSGNTVQTSSLVLSSLSGNIGDGVTPLPIITNANTLSANTAGNVTVTDTPLTGALALNASTGNVIAITVSATGHNFNVAGAVTGTTSVTLTNTGTGAITDTGALLISTPMLTLSAGSGTIGTNAANFQTDTANLTATTTGNVFVNDTNTNGMTLATSSAGTQLTFQVTAAGTISIPDTVTISGNVVSLLGAAASNASIAITTATAGGISGTGTNPVITLTANGSGVITDNDTLGPANITGTNLALHLNSTSGDIGASGNTIQTNATFLAANTTGNVTINDTQTAATTLNASTATNPGSVFTLTVAGSLTTNGAVTADTVSITTAAGKNIVLGAALTGTTAVNLITGTTGNITETAGAIATPTLTLGNGSSTGSFGTSGANLQTTATSLTATTSAGSVFVNDTNAGGVALQTSTAGATFQLASAGPLTVAGTISGNVITLTGSGVNTAIAITGSGALTGTGLAPAVTLTATGVGTITDAAATSITTTTLTLASGSGAIGNNAGNILTNATTLAANTTGSVFINDSSTASITLNSSSASGAGSQFSLNASGLNAANSVTTQTGATITTPTLVVQAATGSIGTAVSNLQTSSPSVSLSAASSGGNVYINDTSATGVSLASSSAGTAGTFQLTSTSLITVSGQLGGNNIVLQGATASNAGITLAANIVGTGTTPTVTLSANGTGAITQLTGNSISATTLSLSSGSGTIGTVGINLATNAGTLTAVTTGNVFVSDSQGNVTIGSSTGATFQVSDTAAGTLQIGASDTLQATTVTLQGTGSNNTNINFPSGSSIAGVGVTDATTVSLKATGTGAITDNAQGAPTIGAVTLNLTATSGGIGTNTDLIQTDSTVVAANTSVTTAVKGVFVNSISSAAVAINASSSESNFSFTAPNATSLTVAGAITSGTGGISNLTLTSGGALTVTAPATGGGAGTGIANLSFTSLGALAVNNEVEATTASLSSTGSTITVGAAGSVVAGSGGATLTSFGAMTVGGQVNVTSTGAATLTAGGVLTINSSVKGNTVALSTSPGSGANIVLAAPITANAGSGTSVTVTADGVGTITETSDSISATGLSLVSGSGTIGTAAANITTNAPTVTGNSLGTVFITDTAGNVTINASKGSTFQLTDTATGNISANATISGTTVTLQGAAGSGAGVIIGANITGLAGGASRATTVTLVADGAGTITDPAGNTVQTSSLILTAANGNIGDNVTPLPIVTNANTLSANTTGNVTVSDTPLSGSLTLNASTGAIIGITITGTGHNFFIGGAITGTTSVSLTNSGTGTITDAGAVLISAPSLTLAAGSGAIGTTGANIQTDTANLQATTTGNVFVNDTNASGVTLASSSAGVPAIFQLTAIGTMTIPDTVTISGNTVSLLGAAGSNAGISITSATSGGILGTGTNPVVNLTAAGSGIISDNDSLGAANITGTNLTLHMTSGSGDIGAGGNTMQTNATTLSANTTGNVTVNDTQTAATTLNASTASAPGSIFTLNTAGSLTANGALTADTVSITTSAGNNIVLGANITGTTAVTLVAGTSGNITQTVGTIATPTLTMGNGTSTGSYGSSFTNLQTNASSLTATTSVGSVFVNDTNAGGVSLATSSAGATFQLSSAGPITVPGTISGNVISLLGTGGNTAIAITSTGALAGTAATPVVTLTATGSGAITDAAAAGNITGTALSLNLTSGSGAIGSNAKSILTNATTLAANTTGNVFINDNSAASITVNDSSASGAGSQFSLNASGLSAANNVSTQVGASITSASLSVQAATGSIGTFANNLQTSASSVTATATGAAAGGNVFVNDTSGTGVFLGASSAGSSGTFQLNAAGAITLSGQLGGNNLTLEGATGSNAGITLGANIVGTGTTPSVTLSANGTGAITQSSGSSISATTLALSSGSGNIGSSNNNIKTNAATLSANTGGNVFATDTLGAAITLNASSSGGSFVLTITGGGNLTQQASTTINAQTVTLISTAGGSFGASTGAGSITTTATTLSANTTGNAFLTDSATGTVALGTSSGATFNLEGTGSGGQITLSGILNSDNATIATQSNGNIAINGNIVGQTSANAVTVVISANGLGSISTTGGTIQTASLTLSSGSGNIGAALNPVLTNAGVLQANTSGNVYVSDTSTTGVTVGGASLSSGNIFNITSSAAGGITVGASGINANTVTLQGSLGSNAGITVTGNINGLAGPGNNATVVTLAADGAGTVNASGTINTNALILSSGTGNLSATSTNASTISANSNLAALGSATVTDINGSTVSLNASNLGAGSFTVNTNGALTVAGAVSAGTETLNAAQAGAAGSLTVSNTITASAANGITLSTGNVTSIGIAGGGILVNGALNSSGNVSLSAGAGGGSAGGAGGAGGNILVAATVSAGANSSISMTGGAGGASGSVGASGGVGGSITVSGTINAGTNSSVTLAGGAGTVSGLHSGNGGDVSVTGTINGSSSTVSLSGGAGAGLSFGGGTASNGGNVTVSGSISGSNIITLSAGAGGGQPNQAQVGGNGGNVTVTATGALDTTGNLNLSGGAGGAGFAGGSTGGNGGSVVVGNAISGATTTITSGSGGFGFGVDGTPGNVNLNGNVFGSTKVSVSTGTGTAGALTGNITQTGGFTITGPVVDLESNTGNIGTASTNIQVNTEDLLLNNTTLNATGNVYVTDLSAATLSQAYGNTFQLTAAGGITLAGLLTADKITLATTANGAINLNADIEGLITNATSVTLNANGTGAISDNVQASPTISTLALTLVSGSGNIGQSLAPIQTNAASLSANTTGSVFVNDSNAVNMGASTGNKITITDPTGITTSGNITATGTLTFNTGSLTNDGTLTGNAIVVTSPVAQGLTILGTGTFTATTSSTLTATANNLTFGDGTLGSQTFNGTANLNATGSTQSVVINDQYTVTGNNTVNLNTNTLTENGSGSITGNPLNFNSSTGAGTIANSSGDVNLASGLVFHGLNLAIIAYGNVTATSAIVIDLSNSSASVNGGVGGALSIAAGINFSPATAGQVGPNGTVYTINSVPSVSGGSITLTGTIINTGSSVGGATGGSVLMVANAGSLNSGSIDTGTIATASATTPTAQGGSVTLIGQGGVSTSTITTAANVSGNVYIASAKPVLTAPITVTNGKLSGGSFTAGTLGGNVFVTSINAGTAGVITLQTGGSGSIKELAGNALSAGSLIMTAGSGGIGVTSGLGDEHITTNAGLLTANAGTTGDVFVSDTAALVTLAPSTVNLTTYHNSADNYNLTMMPPSGSGSITFAASETVTGNTSINLTAGGTSGNILLASGTVLSTPNSGNVVLSAAGSGNIAASDNTSAINTGTLTISSPSGSIGITNAITTSASTITAQANGASGSSVFIKDNGTSAALLADNGGLVNAAGSTGTFSINSTNGFASNAGQTAIAGGNVVLVSSAGSLGVDSTHTVAVSTAFLTAQSSGNVFVSEASGASLLLQDFNGAVNSAGVANTFFINASGSIASNNGQTPVTAGTVVLVAGLGSIGQNSGNTVNVTTTNLTAEANGASADNVFVTQTNGSAVQLQNKFGFANSAGSSGLFFLVNNANATHIDGGISVSAAVTAGAIQLQSSEFSGTGSGITTTGSGVLTAASINLKDGAGGAGNGQVNVVVSSGLNVSVTVSASTLGAVTFTDSDAMAHLVLGNTSAGNLTVNVNSGGSVSTAGGVTLVSASGVLTVNTDKLTVLNGDILQGSTVNINGDTVNGSGLTAMQVNNAGTIQATGTALNSSLNITSALGQELDITGGGTLAANTTSNSQTINLYATDNHAGGFDPNLVFNGSGQTFQFNGGAQTGTVNLLALPGSMQQEIIINTGATLTFNMHGSTVNLNSCMIVFDGTINLNPLGAPLNELVINCPGDGGTIANNTGAPLDLSGLSLIFNGLNLAILSAGDIVNTGAPTTIDLSDTLPGQSGGSLSLIAGFAFTPNTIGPGGTQGPDGTLYQLSNPNTSPGGSIDLNESGHEVDITTAGAVTGGSVFAVANAGSVGLGTITTTGGSGAGGAVTMTGNGIVTDLITTTGGAGSGTVSLTAAANVNVPSVGPPISVGGGSVFGGSFVTGTLGSTNLIGIQLNGITGAGATVNVVTAGTDAITSAAAINVGTLNMMSGTGGITNSTFGNLLTNATTISAQSTGAVLIDNTSNTSGLTLNQSSGTTFTLTTGGALTLFGAGTGLSATTIMLSASGNIVLNNNIAGSLGDATSVSLVTNAGGAIKQGTGFSIAATTLTLSSDTGDIGDASAGFQSIQTDAANLTVSTIGAASMQDSAASVALVPNLALSLDNEANNYSLTMNTNGNIALGSGATFETLTGISSVNLNAGTGSITNGNTSNTSTIASPSLVLVASGGIGANGTTGVSGGTMSVNATTALSADGGTGSNVFLTDTTASSNTVTLLGTNRASNYNLNMSANGNIALGVGATAENLIGNLSVTLNAGTGSIINGNTSNTSTISAPSLTLVATGGIGAAGTAGVSGGTISMNATTALAADAGTGANVFLTDTTASTNTVTLIGTNRASNYNLTMSANGNIALGFGAMAENLIGNATVTLNAGSGSITNGNTSNTSTISSPGLGLIATGGIGANGTAGVSGGAISVNATTALAADAGTGSNVFLTDTTASSNTVSLIGTNRANIYNLTMSANGKIALGLGATAENLIGNASVSLNAGTGTITNGNTSGASTISAPSLTLAATGGIGANGTAGESGGTISVNATTALAADAGTGSNVFLTDTTSSSNTVTLVGTNRANNYNLTMSANGNIALGTGATSENLTGNTLVTLNAGSGSITNGNTSGTSTISAPSLTLAATGGIGANGTAGESGGTISVNATTALAADAGTGSNVFLTDTTASTNTVTLIGTNRANNFNLTMSANGNIALGAGAVAENLIGIVSVSLSAGTGTISNGNTSNISTISAPSLSLVATGGIGAGGTSGASGGTMSVNATTALAADAGTGSNVFITDTTVSTNTVTLIGTNRANNYSLTMSANGSIALGTGASAENLIGNTLVYLNAGTGSVTNGNTSNASTITAPSLILVASSGIGANGAAGVSGGALSVNATTALAADAGIGSDVFITDTTPSATTVTLFGINRGAEYNLNMSANGNIALGAGFNQEDLIGTVLVNLNAGTGTITNGNTSNTSTISTPVLTIVGTGGIGANGTAGVSGGTISVNATLGLSADAGTSANVFLTDSTTSANTVTLVGTNRANSYNLTMSANGSIALGVLATAENLIGTASVSLQAGTGAITNGNTSNTSSISAPSLTLAATGGIGANGAPGVSGGSISINATTKLSADAGTASDLFLNDTTASINTVSLVGTNRANNYNLTTSANGNIALGAGAVSESLIGTTSVNLNAGTGAIANGNTSGTSTIAAPSLTLVGDGGIGANGSPGISGGAISVNATTALAADAGTAGNVFIVDSASSANTSNLTGTNRAESYNLTMSNGANISASTITASQGSIALTTAGNITISTSTTSHVLNLLATGASSVLNLPSGTIGPGAALNMQRDGSNNGGTINLQASAFQVNGSPTSALSLDASGLNSGSGGTAEIQLASTSAVTIGTGNFTLNAQSGATGGAGGSAIFLTNGGLTVNPSASTLSVNAVNGKGGTIDLSAGGALLVTSALSANAATNSATAFAGGEIDFSSNSSTAFNIGSTTTSNTNGIKGALSVAGISGGANGTISVSNSGGGITDATQALTNVSSLSFNTTGAPSATGNITISTTTGSTSTNQITLIAGNAGKIVVTKTSLQTNTTNGSVQLQSGSGAISGITVAAPNLTANTSGAVNLTASLSSGVTLGASSSGASFTLLESGVNGGITLNGNLTTVGATSAVILTANGSGSIVDQAAGADSITANVFTLKSTSGSIGGAIPLRITATGSGSKFTGTTTGQINVNNLGGALSIAGASSKNQPVSFASAGSLTVSGAITAASSVSLTTSNNGSIVVSKNIGATASTVNVTLTAGGSGTISGAGTIADSGLLQLVSTSGNIATSATALKVNSPQLLASTGGLVNISDINTGTTTLAGGSGSGNNFTLNTGGALTLNSIVTTQGSIVAIAATGLLQVASGASITASSTSLSAPAAITLEAKSTTKGLIVIGSSSVIATSGTGGGNVNIVIGPVPTTPTNPYSSTTPPSNTTVNNPAQTFAGAVPAGIIGPASAPNAILDVTGAGVSIVFNTPNVARTITLGSGAHITADPPVVAGAQLINSAPAISTFSGASSVAALKSQIATQELAPALSTASEGIASPMVSTVVASEMGALESGLADISNLPGSSYASGNVPAQSEFIGTSEAKGGKIEAALWSDKELGLSESRNSAADLESTINGGDANVTLHSGNVVFAPTVDTIVESSFGQVTVKAGALVLVMSSQSQLSVFNFDDAHRDSVIVSAGGQKHSLNPGQQMTVTADEVTEFELVNPAESFAYRGVRPIVLGAKLKAFTSEFYTPLAVNCVLPVKQLMKAQSPNTQRIAKHIEKTAAILTQTRGLDDYKLMLHPQVSAYLP